MAGKTWKGKRWGQGPGTLLQGRGEGTYLHLTTGQIDRHNREAGQRGPLANRVRRRPQRV